MKQRILQKFMMTAIAMVFGSISPAMATEFVYELTSSISKNDEVLIVSKSSTGSGYALGHSGSSPALVGVNVLSNSSVANANYIEEDDVDVTSKWTVGGSSNDGWTFKNQDYYIGTEVKSGLNWHSQFVIKNSATDWSWVSGNKLYYHNLLYGNYYLWYNGNNFNIDNSQERNIYIYKKVLKKVIFSATPQNLTFNCDLSQSVFQDITINGSHLRGNVTVTYDGPIGVFSISPNSLTPTNGTITNGTVRVTFHPTTLGGPYNGTVTLKTDGAADIVVNLSATVNTPSLTVTPQALEMETRPGSPVTATFDVSGQHIHGNGVTLSVSDGPFTISPTTLTKAQAQAGATITVTYNPEAYQNYTGTVTISTQGVDNKVVTLKGYSEAYPVVVNLFGVTTLYVDIPLAIPYETYDDKLRGVFVATGVENNEVRLQRLSKGITANTGVMVIGDPGTYYFLKYRGGDLPRPTTNLLYGSTTDIARNDALTQNGKPNGIVMTLGRNANNIIGFYRYTGSTIRANSAFMIYEPTAGSNVTYFSLGGESGEETDGISTVKLAKSDDAWYTLQGARLNGQPTQRGIYIHGGKKVAVK